MLSGVGSRLRGVFGRTHVRKRFGCFDVSPLRAGVSRGKDQYGNTYWEDPSHVRCGSGNRARWIIPHDVKRYDASQIPVGWFGWLQGVTDLTPQNDPMLGTQPWVEPREPLHLSHMGEKGDEMPAGYLTHQMMCTPEHQHSHIQHMQQQMGDPIPQQKCAPSAGDEIGSEMQIEADIPDPVEQQRERYMNNPEEAAHHGRNIVGRMVGQDHYQPWIPARYDAEPKRVI